MSYDISSLLLIGKDLLECFLLDNDSLQLVRRINEAAKDPEKLDELKMVLRVLCHETSYVDECRMFVSKLDVIVKKLEPYLNDTHKVCKAIHICSNSRLDAFHRIGLLYAKRAMNEDLVCDECQFAARELKTIVEDKDKQKEIHDFLSQNICIHLGSYRGMCDTLIEQFLPELFQELDSLLQNPRQVYKIYSRQNFRGIVGFLTRL
ncbi:unnamed protein product [Angiostrongylus costaricensis]|uniref:Saposin B-type domain-containing protein n=1 Tax=Angiostrongylus costaricensis TaxID=334426 RepID=A0A0R3PGC5_ANGCS|nr:unnamed protein product [Angiostrongylus costaricensis]